MRALLLVSPLLWLGCSQGQPKCDTSCPVTPGEDTTTSTATTGPTTTTTTSGATTSATTAGTTTSGATTGATSTGSAVELDCADGVDNDADGLLDCEDGDCALDAACLEADCSNGVDDDGDGRVDCIDEDCWGNGCEVSIAELGGAAAAFTRASWQYETVFGGAGCAGFTSDFEGQVGLRAPYGTIRHVPASTPVWSTCTWTASESAFTIYTSSVPPGVGLPVARQGFALSPGCALSGSDALPDYWGLTYVAGAPAIVTRPNANGPTWFHFNTAIYVPVSSFSTATVVLGSPCNVAYSTYVYGMELGLVPGSDYIQTNP